MTKNDKVKFANSYYFYIWSKKAVEQERLAGVHLVDPGYRATDEELKEAFDKLQKAKYKLEDDRENLLKFIEEHWNEIFSWICSAEEKEYITNN